MRKFQAKVVRGVGRRLMKIANKIGMKGKDDLKLDLGVDLNQFMVNVNDIPGMITDFEARLLLYLAMHTQPKGDVIEIGSWLGRSTAFLARGCKTSGNGIVHAIDTFEGNPGKEKMYQAPLGEGESIYARFTKNIKKTDLTKFVNVYKMTSEQAREKVDTKARLVFIDGCHKYESVKQDINLWNGLLVKSGYLVLHDYTKRFPGSLRAIQEEVVENNDFIPLVLTDTLFVASKK